MINTKGNITKESIMSSEKPKNKNPLIFVVDDDPIYHKLLEYNLNSENYNNIEVYKSGEDCITNIDKKPDVVILDYEMDGMNGLQTLKKIKKFSKDINVIVFSGQENLNVAANTIKFGASNYVKKNEFAYNKIKFIIKKLLN